MLRRLLIWLFPNRKHTWKYHNPYARACAKCGEHQVQECDWVAGTTMMQSYRLNVNPVWEVYQDGDGSCDV